MVAGTWIAALWNKCRFANITFLGLILIIKNPAGEKMF